MLLAAWLLAAVGPVSAQLTFPKLPGTARGSFGVSSVRVSAQFTLSAAGRPARLLITAQIPPSHHIYALDQPPGGPQRTRIVLDPSRDFELAGPFHADPPPSRHVDKTVWVGLEIREHRGRVTWYAPLRFAAGVDPRTVRISGHIEMQVCDPGHCVPVRQPFTARLGPGLGRDVGAGAATASTPTAASTPTVEMNSAPGPALQGAHRGAPGVPAASSSDQDTYDVQAANGGGRQSLGTALVLGFLGGLILNLMPCVLPVIGLKLLSFVEQAGKSRVCALTLNLWYSLGILSVFLVLAALAVVAGMKWGEQFGSDAFNITLATLVFAMGLSLLGVWEIPIPGFVGGCRAAELAEQEGAGAAVVKGVITTVLATPCTGPYIGTVLGWAVRQPAGTTFAVFASMGMGMASPYLLIGAFPALIRWLPKPGAWMVTFKQVMGFVLLGTVIYLLTFIHPAHVVPTVTFLTGVGAGCWWIARTPATAPLKARLLAWGGGFILAAAVGLFAFRWLDDVMAHRFNRIAGSGQQLAVDIGADELPWQPFSPALFKRLTRDQQTVLVDITADWCATCKTLERLVLNTRTIKRIVRRNRVVTLVADYTHRPVAVQRMLDRLQSNGVPVVAIFPAGRARQPIVFRGVYTRAALIAALEKAGPSRVGTAAKTGLPLESAPSQTAPPMSPTTTPG